MVVIYLERAVAYRSYLSLPQGDRIERHIKMIKHDTASVREDVKSIKEPTRQIKRHETATV